MNIPYTLHYMAWYSFLLGREFVYTPPVGGYSLHNEAEWDATTWGEVFDKPSWTVLNGTGYPTLGDWQAKIEYAAFNYAALETAVANLGGTKSFSSPTRVVNTSYRPSTTRDSFVSASATVAVALTLLVGGAGSIILEIASDSGFTTNVAELARTGISGGAGIALAQSNSGQLAGYVPAGYYYRYRTVTTTGAPTFTINAAREVLV